MKALVYTNTQEITYREEPAPKCRENDVIMQVSAAAICGSDMHAYLGHDARRPAPLILGHEAAGTIIGGAQDGRRVTINPLVTCGTCQACQAGRENLCPTREIISMPPREGAFAQYITMPERNLVTVPDTVPMTKAALAEPLAVSWHAARLALAALHPSMDRSALVIGGGAIGLAAALALRAMGLDNITIVEPNPARRDYLTQACGQTTVAQTKALFPLVIDAVGYAATRSLASTHAAPGGVIAHVGLGDSEDGLDVRRMTLQEITFIGTYTYTMQDFRDTAQAIFDGRLGPLDWTENRPLAEGGTAFADLLAGQVASPKIILDPWA
jgi:threonine dehydrogenase-like Zn-dependent dehydrogenase